MCTVCVCEVRVCSVRVLGCDYERDCMCISTGCRFVLFETKTIRTTPPPTRRRRRARAAGRADGRGGALRWDRTCGTRDVRWLASIIFDPVRSSRRVSDSVSVRLRGWVASGRGRGHRG